MASAICAIVKNEGDYIAEWLAHHLALGFDRALVFDNGSTDHTREELHRAARLFPVETRDWPDGGYSNPQAAAYQWACRDLAGSADWVAFLDADEFLVSRSGEQVPDLLARHHAWAGIAVNWLVFGSSGHEQKPDGLVLEAFPMRSDIEFPPNRHVKCIVRPEAVRACHHAHAFVLDGAICDAAGHSAEWQQPGVLATPPEVGNWRVHHYFTRHRGSWATKIARGRAPRDKPRRTVAEFAAHDRNDVHDPAALRYVPAVRAMLARFDGGVSAATCSGAQ